MLRQAHSLLVCSDDCKYGLKPKQVNRVSLPAQDCCYKMVAAFPSTSCSSNQALSTAAKAGQHVRCKGPGCSTTVPYSSLSMMSMRPLLEGMLNVVATHRLAHSNLMQELLVLLISFSQGGSGVDSGLSLHGVIQYNKCRSKCSSAAASHCQQGMA